MYSSLKLHNTHHWVYMLTVGQKYHLQFHNHFPENIVRVHMYTHTLAHGYHIVRVHMYTHTGLWVYVRRLTEHAIACSLTEVALFIKNSVLMCKYMQSHPRQLIFSLKNNCLWRVVLCCFVFLLCCVALPCLSKYLMDD